MKLIKAVAMRVSNLLIKQKISQYELSQRAGLTKQAVSNIINEKYESVKLDTVIKLADGFNITFQEFFKDDIFERENLNVE